ncbi:protein dachsous-like [Centropristis striata]|uniref:protein dachsous-like n=1 Tax=Centropristis striata TaxID=184440 RepID=UPI0027E14822|nr:protein dachsous-like [Centropristis striata]
MLTLVLCASSGRSDVHVVHSSQCSHDAAGDIEVVSGITAGSGVKLVPYLFSPHLEFLELSFTLGDTSATVRTKKLLDADMLSASDSTLYYSVMCDSPQKFNNTRTLKVNDLNDNGPIFPQETYSIDVSEIKPVDSVVLQVTAVDADSSPANNQVSYSYVPASEDFILTNSGDFILKRRLNYNVAPRITGG